MSLTECWTPNVHVTVFGHESRLEDVVRRRHDFDDVCPVASSVRGINKSEKCKTRWIGSGRVRTSIDVGVWLAREDCLPQREIDHLQEESAEDPHIPWKLLVQLQRQPDLFLRFTFEAVQAQLLAQSRRGLAIVTLTLSASAFMTLSKKGLKVSVEGCRQSFVRWRYRTVRTTRVIGPARICRYHTAL